MQIDYMKDVPFLVGYIDPSAGQVFQSMGPLLTGVIGAVIGAIIGLLSMFKKKIIGVFKKDKKTK